MIETKIGNIFVSNGMVHLSMCLIFRNGKRKERLMSEHIPALYDYYVT